MFQTIKKSTIQLSIVAAIALSPSLLQAASASGAMEGSSESISAAIEQPNFEGQLVRINTAVNLVRLNTDILESMPVSLDAEWVDEVVAPLTEEQSKKTMARKEVQEDAYYSTVGVTNAILGRTAIPISPLGIRLYTEAAVIYEKIPDMNVFPEITNPKTYITFKDVKLKKVKAVKGTLYKNVEEATISLLPDALQEEVIAAQKEFKQAKIDAGKAKADEKLIEAWLDDDKNQNSPEIAEYNEKLKVAQLNTAKMEEQFKAKEEAYFLLLEKGSEAIEASFDASKIPLAKKLEKLLDTVDNNVIGAISLYASATAGLVRGLGQAGEEIKAITKAQLVIPVGQKQKLDERYARMAKGALLAIPNIFIGSYYATTQSSLAGKYQQIVDKVIEGAKVLEKEAEAAKKAKEAEVKK